MKYSIVIPTHNRPKDIQKFFKQLHDLNDSEVIFVENGSSKENLNAYKEIDMPNKFRLIHTPPKDTGAGNARNFGLKNAKADYVFFMDDDDNFFDDFIPFLNKHTPSHYVERFSYMYGKGVMSPGIGKTVKKMNFFNTVQPSTFLLNRKFALKNKIFFPPYVVHQDVHFMALIWKNGTKQYINKGIFSMDYTTDNFSITRSKKSFKIEDASISVFDTKEYDGCNIWKFRILYDINRNFVKKDLFIEGEQASKKWLKNHFKKLKFTFRNFIELPIYFKFVYLIWKIHIV